MARMTPFNTNAFTQSNSLSLSDNVKLYMCLAALGLSFAPLSLPGEVQQQLSFLSHISGDQVASYLHCEDRTADNLQLWLTLLAPLDFKYIIFNIRWQELSVSWNSFRYKKRIKMEALMWRNFWRTGEEFNLKKRLTWDTVVMNERLDPPVSAQVTNSPVIKGFDA